MPATLFPALVERIDGTALRMPGGELGWDELARACAGHIARLRRAGIRPGERVAVWARPTLQSAVAIVGNLAAGVATVPLNPKLGSAEAEHILAKTSPSAVFDDPDLELGAVADIYIEIDDKPALIIFTSGTTGPPKGAVLSVANIARCIDGLAEAWLWTRADEVVHALPLFHVHGLVLGLLGSLRVGGSLRVFGRFDPAEIAAALEGPSGMLFSVPTMIHRLADAACEDEAIARGLRRARMVISGSAALAGRDARLLRDRFGVTVHQRYGLTETLINTAARFGEPADPSSVGAPLHGIELRIVDERRCPVESGEMGEVAVRGNVFAGYLDDPDATGAVLDDDGWFYTGDVGCVGADGALRLLGRKSTDLIKTGGYKVGAGEIEACLLEYEGVAEVAVVGVPDDDLGERIEAHVVARDGAALQEASLAEWVSSRLSPHKRPRVVHLVGDLPRNAMGKVQKARLRGD